MLYLQKSLSSRLEHSLLSLKQPPRRLRRSSSRSRDPRVKPDPKARMMASTRQPLTTDRVVNAAMAVVAETTDPAAMANAAAEVAAVVVVTVADAVRPEAVAAEAAVVVAETAPLPQAARLADRVTM